MMPRTTFFLTFFLFVLLAGCATAPPQLNEPTINSVPPEPTNTLPPPTTPLSAVDPCTTAAQQAQIDQSYAAYQAARSLDGDAVAELANWMGGISAEIITTCNNAIFQPTDPETLKDLLGKLQSGGYVVYVRHTHTDRSRGDTDVSFGLCDQQRILSDRGRDEARLIRNAYDQLDLPVSLLISTQYCRTLETAVLAFDVPQVISRSQLHETLLDWLATEPETGTNVFIVAHIGTIRDRVGLDDTFEEGDSLIYRPIGDTRFEYVGRIGLYDWPMLAELNK
ncbi:MAG: hypothetical protein ACPG8W_15100 [Candidatus Promineifilaceae bacterium]